MFNSLRKEVIQPHLPVRLPCYDFVLLVERTLITSLPVAWFRKCNFRYPQLS